MNKTIFFLVLINFFTVGHSQIPVKKKIDSLVSVIESKKTLSLNSVADTFATQHSNLLSIENVKFYSLKNKLVKVSFTTNYFRKDSTVANMATGFEIFYFNDDLLIKVISRDFDQSPPKNIEFYLNEKDRQKYLSKQTMNASRYDGVNYFVEIGYGLLDEFRSLNHKKAQ
ncbi:MAG TPA: hypothetical protein VF144_06380 [Chitinophagaceae bacterium]